MSSQEAQLHWENKRCRNEAKLLAFTFAVIRLKKNNRHNSWYCFYCKVLCCFFFFLTGFFYISVVRQPI